MGWITNASSPRGFYFANENIAPSNICLAPTAKPISGSGYHIAITQEHNLPPTEIEIIQGRSIVFKNSLSRRSTPFELVDPTRRGHLKFITFFLVDPGTTVLSTAKVPCQKKSWYLGQVKEILGSKLPLKIVERIVLFLTSHPLGPHEIYLDDDEADKVSEAVQRGRLDWRMCREAYYAPCKSAPHVGPHTDLPKKRNIYP